jgi:large subunit ribosomal protein L10
MAKTKAVYKSDPNRKGVKEKAGKVSEIKSEMKSYPTVALIDLRMLPDSLLQNIRKKVREEGGSIKIAKKAVMGRVFDGVSALAGKKTELNKPVGLILTKMSPYKLNLFFNQNKKKRAAKIDELALFDIVVPEGETDLPPGPALSELKTAGLNVQIKAGKIVIAKESTIAKKGEKITAPKVGALQKLNIKPFETAVNLIFAYDGEYLYSKDVLDIDVNALLVDAFNQSRNVSINGSLYSNSTMEQLLTSAVRQGLALAVLDKKEVTQ